MRMSGIAEWADDYKQSQGEDMDDEEEPPTPWSEELCEELWDRVEGVRHKLTRILNPAKLTPYLRQCKVIDEQDEDEVLNSTQYPLRISKAGRLLDILRGRSQRGLQAFMESLEFYHPEQFTQLTGKQPTQRCSIILDEEGPEGLTQFLLVEVRKLREQLRGSRLCERRLSQRCRVAEEERSRAERKTQDLRHDRLQMERLRQDWEAGSRELGRLKERLLEQAVKYSRALEEQALASIRERELLTQMEKLKNRLIEADKQSSDIPFNALSLKRHSAVSNGNGTPPPLPDKPLKHLAVKNAGSIKTQALLDILEQDRREAAEQRHELCDTITRIQGELESSEELQEKLEAQCEQLQLKVRTLQLDWETEQKRSISYFNQIMELEKERDQALRSRDSLQLEFTDCLLDKNRLRKRIAELQANLEQQERELEKERERSLEQMKQSNSGLNCSHLSVCSEDQCYGPCCSLGMDLCLTPQPNGTHQLLRKAPSRGQASDRSDGSRCTSEENLLTPTEDSEKEINRLSIFPFPPCANSINRRFNTEFDLDSWGSDENDLTAEHGDHVDLSLSDSWSSLTSHLFPPDLVSLPPVPPHKPSSIHLGVEPLSPSRSPPSFPKRSRGSLADEVTIVGGNNTGIFVSSVGAGSPAEQCGLTEGSELLELESVLFSGESVLLGQCTGEVAHFSLQWWTEPSSLKHKLNKEAYSKLQAQRSSATFLGPDSFYVRVNLDMDPHGDPPCLGIRCDDIMHVTDTHYNGKYQWRCSLVEQSTAKPLQTGSMPNYNRAQQLLLVRLRTMALEQQKDFKRKMLCKKDSGRIRLVKAVSPSCRGIGSKPQVLYTLSYRQEEHLIPYSMVQPIQFQSKRPVIFSPSILSRGLIERLLQPADSGLDYNTCQPEPTQPSDRCDKKVFLLNSSTPEQALGIRLQSIQEVISQNKHCLLELGLGSVEGLLRQGVYPIVIHIRPKTKNHKKLRKLLPGRGEEGVMMEAVCQAEELQLETLPMLYYTLDPTSWSCTEELLAAIRSAIHSQQRAVAWVEMDKP